MKTTQTPVRAPLACDYWLTPRTKCAETAVVRLERDGTDCCACRKHKKALLRSMRSK